MDLLALIRDIAIIVLAVETIVVGLAALVLIFSLWKLVGVVRRHLDKLVGITTDVLGTTADTARDVRGTTTFVADHAARPLIQVISALTGMSQFARAAFSRDRGNGQG
ncbi:MAG: hypothetical protein EXR58_04505 [Chloroflexi bacterium]|nr:hypothetical protein [Chloroflexota bacterium]